MSPKLWIAVAAFAAAVFGEISAVKISCIKCTTETDPNCSRAKLQPSVCAQEDDVCYMRIFGNHLVRGCFKELTQTEQTSCDSNGGLCIKCQADGCNNGYWPRCHTCDESYAQCSEEQSGVAPFCRQYFSDNYCYASLQNGLISRGCASDYLECLIHRDTCQMCHSDGCNSLAKADLKTSNCQKCYSSDSDCTEGTSTALSQSCSRLADPCFTTIEGNKVYRGCLDFAGSDKVRSCSDPDDATCVACVGSHCNNRPWLRCHQCKVTDADNSCNEERADPANATYCTNHRVGDKCYARTVDGVFERGCQSDLGVNVSACDGLGEKECQLCAEPGCNKERNAAGLVAFSVVIVTLGVVFSILA